jgi:hypothetical protein
MKRALLITTLAAASGALVIATFAAASEAKNQKPFNRPVQTQSSYVVSGEPKDERPFTTRVDVNPTPDSFERYAAAHPYGRGLGVATTPVATRDSFERYAAAHPYGRGLDVATAASPIAAGASTGFHWRDALLGAATAAGALLAAYIGFGAARRRRQLAGPVGV